MKLTIECERGGAVKIHADDGIGWVWTPDPSRAIWEICERIEKFVTADLRLRRDGCKWHVRVLKGVCPECGMPAPDCVGDEWEGP